MEMIFFKKKFVILSSSSLTSLDKSCKVNFLDLLNYQVTVSTLFGRMQFPCKEASYI